MEAIKEFFNISYGDGYGDGYGIAEFDGKAVYAVDGIQTLLFSARGMLAKGAILNSDLTTTPCFVFRHGNVFAHGATSHEAREAALEKAFDGMPEEDRIEAFVKNHKPGKIYPNKDFFSWHHRLTGSCLMGRQAFASDHGIDVDNGSMTPEAFILLTENAYGAGTIRKLKQFYSTGDS